MGYIYQVGSSAKEEKVSPRTLHFQVNGLTSEWEIDSGAVVAICGDDLYRRLPDRPPLRPETSLRLQPWGERSIEVLGTCQVTVKAGTEEILLPLYVAKGWGVPLIGRNWFAP